jgi:L-ascorbate metabolism protein UlaG (beta-lactamase superfamily)
MDWWESSSYKGIELICTPSRHFSGRGITDRNSSLWSSWIIQNQSVNLYFSGDGGYGPHFREIGEKFGPFDFAMMECGQYDLRWHQIHMLPEETALAAKDLEAETFMPIHWGSFVLALHSWYDPVDRVTTKAEELGLNAIVPQIGEVINLAQPEAKKPYWWKGLK